MVTPTPDRFDVLADKEFFKVFGEENFRKCKELLAKNDYNNGEFITYKAVWEGFRKRAIDQEPTAGQNINILLATVSKLPSAIKNLDVRALKNARCNICEAIGRLANSAMDQTSATFMRHTSPNTRNKIGKVMVKTGNAAKILTALPVAFGAHLVDQSGKGNAVITTEPMGFAKASMAAALTGLTAVYFYKACDKFVKAGQNLIHPEG